tara:strand:+ start:5531 stop:6544 length:1014 start_codon:yes stop_codon:yes gene_type:complete
MKLLDYYNYNLNKETLNVEFKRFCLNYDLCVKYNEDEIKKIITTGTWSNRFSNYVNDSICNYVYCILPKYIATFLNTGIEGKVVFGVDDNGIITGIPVNKNLTKKRITSCINKTINDNIKTNNNKKNILNNINVNIKKITGHNITNTDISDIMYRKYQNDIKIYNNEFKNYKMKYDEWCIIFNKYRIKLNELINNVSIKEELINHIDRNCFIFKKNSIIEYLKYNNNFDLTTEFIIKNKNRINSYVYWLIHFKDYMISNIQPKPILPNKPKLFHYVYILMLLTPMINKFLLNNINYIIIEINIKTQKNTLNDLMYKDKKGCFVYKKRYSSNDGPFTF